MLQRRAPAMHEPWRLCLRSPRWHILHTCHGTLVFNNMERENRRKETRQQGQRQRRDKGEYEQGHRTKEMSVEKKEKRKQQEKKKRRYSRTIHQSPNLQKRYSFFPLCSKSSSNAPAYMSLPTPFSQLERREKSKGKHTYNITPKRTHRRGPYPLAPVELFKSCR